MRKLFYLISLLLLFVSCDNKENVDPIMKYVYEYSNNTSYDIEVITWHMSYGEILPTSHIVPKGSSLIQDCTFFLQYYYADDEKKRAIPYTDSLVIKWGDVVITPVFVKNNQLDDRRLNLYKNINYELSEIDEWKKHVKYTFTEDDFEN